MPRATFTHRVSTTRSAADIWDRLQDAATWSGIGGVDEVWDPVHDESGRLRSYRWRAGPTRQTGTATVVASEPESRIEMALDGGEVAGLLTATMEQNGSVTALVVSLEIASQGPLSAVVFPFVAEAIRRGLPEQVDRFVAALEND